MTKQEAIDILWKYDVNFEPHPAEEVMHAIDMAIEALSNSQNPSVSELKTKTDSVSATDVIYRADAIEELRDVIVKYVQFGDELTDGYNDGIDMAITVISKLPSAQPTLRERALMLLLNWAEECGFGYDNFSEEYDRYKDQIVDMSYIDGMIYIAEKEVERKGEDE